MQRLHGMGEAVYREVPAGTPLRVYAPVGEHRDLLAYLVRRLLENGANSSFVHQLSDSSVSVEALLASPFIAGDTSGPLPLPVDLGSLVVFGAPPRGLVLVRLVVVRAELLDLHARVHAALEPSEHDARHTTPGHWTPHVTLAHRMTPDQLARAIEVLDEAPTAPLDGARLVAGRRWDGTAKVVTEL